MAVGRRDLRAIRVRSLAPPRCGTEREDERLQRLIKMPNLIGYIDDYAPQPTAAPLPDGTG